MTKDEQEERELFVEQTAKKVVGVMADHKLTPMEMLNVVAAIHGAIVEEMEGRG